jgi:hypothetical protein
MKKTHKPTIALIDAVKSGRISPEKAAEIAKLPETTQMRVIRNTRQIRNRLATAIRITAIENSDEMNGGICMLCNPKRNITDDEALRNHLQVLGSAYPKLERYFEAIIEEMDETLLADKILTASKQVLLAVDTGICDFRSIKQKTKLSADELELTIANLLEYGDLEIAKQGKIFNDGATSQFYKRPKIKDEKLKKLCTDCDLPVGKGYAEIDLGYVCKSCQANEKRLGKAEKS